MTTTDVDPRESPRPFADFRDEGLLWLINAAVFHPRGYAIAFHYDDDGNATGWSLAGQGWEPWHFADVAEIDELFRKATALLTR